MDTHTDPRPNPLHDADDVLGRIRKDGGWDRRYRIKPTPPEPERGQWADAIEVMAGLIVLTLLFAAVYIWMLIGAAAQ